MAWMALTQERRVDPRALMPAARRLVMVGLNYGPEGDPLATLARPHAGAISVYARNRDYHDLIKGKLKELAGFLSSAAKPETADVKVFVDTAPLMEKPLAARAGVGWQGKHTNLVSREFGSWLFLGAILTDLDLPIDEPETDHCGSCRACLEICPTDAFPAPYQLDARRCISYLTIEHKGPISSDLRPLMETASTDATIVSLSVHGTSLQPSDARQSFPRARTLRRRRSPNWRRSTKRDFALNSQVLPSRESVTRASYAT